MSEAFQRSARRQAAAQAAEKAAQIGADSVLTFRALTEQEIEKAVATVLGLVLELAHGDRELVTKIAKHCAVRVGEPRQRHAGPAHTYKRNEDERPITETAVEAILNGWLRTLEAVAPIGRVQEILGELVEEIPEEAEGAPGEELKA